jgi:curli biogenesis system outer membrane secretion channel CsgG
MESKTMLTLRGAAKAAVFGVVVALVGTGCANTKEGAEADTVTKNVGVYSPPPSGLQKVAVGVPQFKVESIGFGSGSRLDEKAADQMSSLLHQCRRFDVIERAQLEQLLKEQNMEGIVKPGELAKPGLVQGVKYLCIGKVTNFRIKVDEANKGAGTTNTGFLSSLTKSIGEVGYNQRDVKITTDCGVDLRLVDPTTGKVAVAHFAEFKRTDSAGGMGFSFGGIKTTGNADITITDDDAGKALRLALDDALRKMLPEIDQVLQEQSGGAPVNTGQSITVAPGQPPAPPAVGSGAPAPAAVVPAVPAAPAVAGKKFCPECGKEVAAGAKFCPSCGAKTGS